MTAILWLICFANLHFLELHFCTTSPQNSCLVARSLKTLDFSRVFSAFWDKF